MQNLRAQTVHRAPPINYSFYIFKRVWDLIRRILHSQLSIKYMLPTHTPEIGWIKFLGPLVIRRGRMSLPKFQNTLILSKGILTKLHSENIEDLAVTGAKIHTYYFEARENS